MTGSQKKFGEALAAAALQYVGTPFHHQGRHGQAGLDCIGLVVVSLQKLGFEVRDNPNYGPRPDGKSLVAALDAHGAKQVAPEATWADNMKQSAQGLWQLRFRAGDVLLFRYDNQPQHVAIALSEHEMVHSFAPAKKVVVAAIGRYWRCRLVGAYRFYPCLASL